MPACTHPLGARTSCTERWRHVNMLLIFGLMGQQLWDESASHITPACLLGRSSRTPGLCITRWPEGGRSSTFGRKLTNALFHFVQFEPNNRCEMFEVWVFPGVSTGDSPRHRGLSSNTGTPPGMGSVPLPKRPAVGLTFQMPCPYLDPWCRLKDQLGVLVAGSCDRRGDRTRTHMAQRHSKSTRGSGVTVTCTSSSCRPPPSTIPRNGVTSLKSRPQPSVMCSCCTRQ